MKKNIYKVIIWAEADASFPAHAVNVYYMGYKEARAFKRSFRGRDDCYVEVKKWA